MSRTSGIFSRVTVSSVSSAAAMQGRAEFFAPEMRTVPTSGLPPRITNLSMEVSSGFPVAEIRIARNGCGWSGAGGTVADFFAPPEPQPQRHRGHRDSQRKLERNRPPNVAFGGLEALLGVLFLHAGLEHDEGDGDVLAAGLQCF